MESGFGLTESEMIPPESGAYTSEAVATERAVVRQRQELPRTGQKAILKLAFEELPVPILRVEKKTGRIHAVNPAVTQRYGLTPEVLEGTTLAKWLLSEEGNQSADFDLLKARKLQTATGEIRDIALTVSEDPLDPQTFLMLVIDDQTERRLNERNLRKVKRRLANILDSVSEGYIAIDRDGLLTFANRAAQTILQRNHADLTGQPCTTWLSSADAAALQNACGIALAKQTSFELEFLIRDESHALTFESPGETLERCWKLRGYPSQDGISLYLADTTEVGTLTAQLAEKTRLIKSTLDGTIHAMSHAMSLRDPYTAGHQRRVSKLVMAMAKMRGCNPDEIERYREAALLHDIGKITLPAEILSKPGYLSPAEMSIIRTHARTGYEMLKGIEFEPMIALVALQHHERMDGSGYPNGLVGKEIMPEARMMAVADVVEAMSSHRPFRPALGIEPALKEVIQNQGTLYEEKSVEACLAALGQFDFDLEQLIASQNDTT